MIDENFKKFADLVTSHSIVQQNETGVTDEEVANVHAGIVWGISVEQMGFVPKEIRMRLDDKNGLIVEVKK